MKQSNVWARRALPFFKNATACGAARLGRRSLTRRLSVFDAHRAAQQQIFRFFVFFCFLLGFSINLLKN